MPRYGDDYDSDDYEYEPPSSTATQQRRKEVAQLLQQVLPPELLFYSSSAKAQKQNQEHDVNKKPKAEEAQDTKKVLPPVAAVVVVENPLTKIPILQRVFKFCLNEVVGAVWYATVHTSWRETLEWYPGDIFNHLAASEVDHIVQRQEKLRLRLETVRALAGSTWLIYKLLNAGCHMEHEDKYGRTQFLVCCEKGHTDLAKVLTRVGARVDATDARGHNGLHLAAANGHHEIIKFLLFDYEDEVACELKKAYKVSALTDGDGTTGNTPLHYGVKSSNKIVQLILRKCSSSSAVVNARNNVGATPLYLACTAQRVGTVKLLLSKQPAIVGKEDNQDGGDNLSLNEQRYYCCGGGCANPDIATQGMSALENVIFHRRTMISGSEDLRVEMVCLLLRAKASFDPARMKRLMIDEFARRGSGSTRSETDDEIIELLNL